MSKFEAFKNEFFDLTTASITLCVVAGVNYLLTDTMSVSNVLTDFLIVHTLGSGFSAVYTGGKSC